MTIDLTQLAADLTTFRAAVTANGSFIGESAADMAPVVIALDACIADVTSAMAQAETIMSATDTTVAGVVAGQDGATNAADFLAYLSVNQQVPNLLDMQSYLNRIGENLAAGVV